MKGTERRTRIVEDVDPGGLPPFDFSQLAEDQCGIICGHDKLGPVLAFSSPVLSMRLTEYSARALIEALHLALDEFEPPLGLGATGVYPEGKENEADEGELRFGVRADGRSVRVVFGKPVAHLGMDGAEALDLAAKLTECAHEALANQGKH